MVGKKIEGEAEEHNKKDYLDTYVFESKHFYGIKSKHTLIPLCIYAVFLLLGLWIVYNRNLTIVKMLSNGCEGIAMFYAGVLIYSSSCGFSTILYKIMADCFQKKYKYELRKGDMNLTYKISVSFIEFLNLPWIFLMLVYNWIMEKLDIYQLREIILFWIASTSILLLCGISCLEGLIESVFFLIKECPWLLNQYITPETWVYFVMLIVVGSYSYFEKNIWRMLVKFYEKNYNRQKKMQKEHEVFIAYLNLLLTIVLQAFHFEGAEDILVKALFYSTGILAMWDKIREKTGKEKS